MIKLRAARIPVNALPGNMPRPRVAAQVAAELNVRYYRVEFSPNGKTIRFIYAVQQHHKSPWRIAAIGSGP